MMLHFNRSIYSKILVFTILLATCFLFSSCQSDDVNISRAETFSYNQIGGLESLDPAFAKNLAIMWPVHLLYNTLLEVDSSLALIPSIADSWSISADGMRYIFHLRSDVYFHDNTIFPEGKGRKMTAQDWVYSFQRIIDPKTASPGAWVFNDRVAKENPFSAIDDSTFVIQLIEPFAPFLQILSMPYCSVVPEEAVAKYGQDFRNHPVGTGPFAFKTWDEGNILILHRNEQYWERDAADVALPYLRAVRVSFHESKAMEFLLLKEGKVDFINGIDGSIKDLVLSKKGNLQKDMKDVINLRKSSYLNTEYLGILVDTAKNINVALHLPKVRHAINYGIDKQKVVTYFRNGIGKPAYAGFTPTDMPGMSDSDATTSFQPTLAAQMIQEVKDSMQWPVIRLEISSPESHADMCNFIARQLIEIGIEAKVQVYQPGMLRQMMSQGQVQCFKAQWIADYPDAESYLAYFYSILPAPPNYTRFNNATFDNMYRQAMQTEEPAARFILYKAMDSLAHAQNAVIPLFYDELLHFTAKNIEGFSSNAMNIIDIKRVRKRK